MPRHLKRTRGRHLRTDETATRDARRALSAPQAAPKHMKQEEGRPWWAFLRR